MKIRDPKTRQWREETAEEKTAREEREKAERERLEGEIADLSEEELRERVVNLTGEVEREKAQKRRAEDRLRGKVEQTGFGSWEELVDAAQKHKEGKVNESDAVKAAEQKQKDAERERDEAQRELLRLRVGARKGLTEAQAKRLVGDTEEELEDDADELLTTFRARAGGEGDEDEDEHGEHANGNGRPKGGTAVSRLPRERLKGGATRPGEKGDFDAKKVVDEVMTRDR